jgi:hypothetical protein
VQIIDLLDRVTNQTKTFKNGGSTVVEHLSHHPKVKGLSSATATDTGRYKMAKKVYKDSSDQLIKSREPLETAEYIQSYLKLGSIILHISVLCLQ